MPSSSNRGLGEKEAASASGLGTVEYASDLEDRVAKLEQGLLTFRGQLAQMSADRNRRTVIIGGVPQQGYGS